MYHYVRLPDSEFPNFQFLHLEDFIRQLSFFEKEYGFVGQDDFLSAIRTGRSPDGIVLTFDDGFADHVRFVLPELEKRGLWGIFYVPTGPHQSRRLLDVHRIHCLLGKWGGTMVFEAVRSLVTDDMLSDAHIDEFRRLTYGSQKNDDCTLHVKRALNYFIDYRYRGPVLDRLMQHFKMNEPQLVERFYMSPAQLKQLSEAGMIIGSHSINHLVMSKLSDDEQRKEIDGSFRALEGFLGKLPVRTFCYPYGGFHSFSDNTESLLSELGCQFAFNVEPRDILSVDIQSRPQALPRYDCNRFPDGLVRPLLSN